jgi:branched-chain amino acid transport system permease protein|tara:strand:+ start:4072 stop:4980 length:909 start_codon:yes stop_codon:yes gene_type:complete
LVLEQLLNSVQYSMTLFLMAAGLTLVFGVMGVINLAHGSLYMVGAFACAAGIQMGAGFFVSLLFAVGVAALTGAVIEIVVVRQLYQRDHLDQVLATFALILMANELMRWLFGSFPLSLDVPVLLQGTVALPFGVTYSVFRLFIIAMSVVVAAALFVLIARTRLGVRIRAGQSDREMVAALGVNIRRLYTVVFAIGAGLAGLAGALIGSLQSVQVGMGEPVLIIAFVVIIIGGIGSIFGSLVAALLVGTLDVMGKFLLPIVFEVFMPVGQAASMGSALASVAIYVLMAAVLLFKPQGLFGKPA